jgi:hypothetical protein
MTLQPAAGIAVKSLLCELRFPALNLISSKAACNEKPGARLFPLQLRSVFSRGQPPKIMKKPPTGTHF